MFLCIYIPDFPVQALIRHEPELRERAVAVLLGTPPLVRVMALNDKARALGMEIGITKIEAGAFAEREPEPLPARSSATSRPRYSPMSYGHRGSASPRKKPVHRIPHGAVLKLRSPEQEASAHAGLLDAIHAFSPRVEDIAPGMVLADMAGMERLFGSAQKIAVELACRVGKLGIDANIAAAARLETAALAAHGFPGTTMIPPGREAERIGPLSTEVLCHVLPLLDTSLDAARMQEMLEILDRWGIRTLQGLAALPCVPLSERLGAAGLQWQRLAQGDGWRTLQATEPSLQFEEAMELDCAVELLEPLGFVLARLLDQLCLRLASRSLAVQELRIQLQLEHSAGDETVYTPEEMSIHSDVYERTLRLPVPMQDSKILLKLLQLELDANPPGAPVLKVAIAAEPAKPRRQQDGFFLPAAPETEKLEITLARIQRVVGKGRAGRAVLLDTHRPDAFRMEPFRTIDAPPTLASKSGTRGWGTPATRGWGTTNSNALTETLVAIRVFRPPIGISVDLHDGYPRRIRLLQTSSGLEFQSADILWAAGPWHTSGEWWNTEENATAWEDEEWDVALLRGNQAALYRIVHRKNTLQWVIAAEYD